MTESDKALKRQANFRNQLPEKTCFNCRFARISVFVHVCGCLGFEIIGKDPVCDLHEEGEPTVLHTRPATTQL